ncbi:MAG: hypothetical protein WBS24_09725 [Terriglobales bacterium]
MNWMRIACSLVLCTLFTAVATQRAHGSLLTQEEPKAGHESAPEMQQPEQKPETPAAKPEQQPDKQETAKPEQQQKDETKDQTTQDQTKDQTQDQSKDQNKNLTKEQKKEQKKQQKQNKDQSKVNNNNSEKTNAATGSNQERTNAAAGNTNMQGKMQGKGGHIPDDKFRANFGKGHTFVVNHPVIVNNQPTFQYGGYTFIMAQPWPMGWAYTDDCYIDYIDGEYFLFDLLHPGVQIEIFVNG